MFKNKPVTAFTLLLLFFVIPFLIAHYLFQHRVNIFHKTTNKGVLLQPMREIRNLPLQTLDGKTFDVNQWKGHWVLVYISGRHFSPETEKAIYYLRQIRTATGKNQTNVMRAYISAEAAAIPPAQAIAQIQKQFAGTDLLKTSHEDLVKYLNEEGLSNVTLSNGVFYIVDPQGYMMMRYPVVVNPEDIYTDLDHLLHINS